MNQPELGIKIVELRKIKGITQDELANKCNINVRTIQRIEAVNIPKGFTLKALVNVFETEPEKLIPFKEITKLDRAKLINFSSLCGLVIPFGGVIFPLILTYKTNDSKNKELGKSIVSVQILIAVALVVSQIASPFIQKGLSLDFPLFIVPLLLIICLKLLVVIVNGISLNSKHDLHKNLKINYL